MVVYSIIESLRTVHASRVIHKKMLDRILHAPMAFFDTTPIGRIVNRFSRDIDTIDMELPMTFLMGLDSACIVLSTLIVISYSTPYFLVAILPLFCVYLLVQVRLSLFFVYLVVQVRLLLFFVYLLVQVRLSLFFMYLVVQVRLSLFLAYLVVQVRVLLFFVYLLVQVRLLLYFTHR